MPSDTEPIVKFAFPVPKLAPLVGPNGIPTRLQLLKIQTQLNANARSVVSTLSPAFGLLALTISPARYQQMNGGVAFVPPPVPPEFPPYPEAPTQFQIVEISRMHAVRVKAHTDFVNADRALFRLLRDVVPEEYLEELEDPEFEFADVTTLQALEHLHAQFATVTSDDLNANRERMEADWHPPTAIAKLFNQLTQGQRFANENGETIHNNELARIGFNLIVKTGLFPEGCHAWRLRPEAEKTFAHFRTFFAAQDVVRRSTATTQSAGYHGAANAATAPGPPAPTLSEVAQMMIKMNERMDQFMASATAPKSTVAPSAPKVPRERGYCWTHGHTSGTNHTSASCKYPADGHQEDATAQNQMGGSTAHFRAATRNNRNRNRNNRGQQDPDN
jgi:hypothetical protein